MKRVEIKGILSFTYTGYPDCCLMGIIHGFGGAYKIEQKELDKVAEVVEQTIRNAGHTSAIIADVEGNAGYRVFIDNPKVQVLASEFNKNSGNSVYIMQYSI